MFQSAFVVVAGAKVQTLVGYSMLFYWVFLKVFFSWLGVWELDEIYFLICRGLELFLGLGLIIVALIPIGEEV